MADRITLTYNNGIKDTSAAMIKGGQTLGARYRDWTLLILSWVVMALIAGGGGFVALGVWIFVLDQDQTFPILLPICVIMAILLGRWMFARMVTAQAKMTLGSRFGRLPQTLTIDAAGITQHNDHAQWRTNWSGVEAVEPTKHGLAVTISGVVFAIPNTGFDNGPSKEDVLSQMQAWHKAAQ